MSSFNGHELKNYKHIWDDDKTIDNSVINVIYIDNYENVITNISKTVFDEFGKSRPYVINARNYKFFSIL